MKRRPSSQNNTKKPVFLRLAAYLAHFPWTGLLALILVFSANVFNLIGPTLSGKAIDAIRFDAKTLTADVDFPTVARYCLWMALFYLSAAILSYVLSFVMISYSQKITRRLRREVFDKLLALPVGYFDHLQAGDVINRFSYDIDVINTSLANDLLQIFNSLITITGAFWCMIRLSWQLLLVFLVTVPLSVYYTVRKTRKVRPLFRARSKELGTLNGVTEELLSGVKTIRAYGKEPEFGARYQEENVKATEAYYQADYQSATLGPSVNFINNLSMSLISVFGAAFYLWDLLSLGNISSFLLYSRKFSGPINEFSNILADLQSLRSAAERIFTLLDEKTEPEDAPDAVGLGEVRGEITFDHVSFSYDPSKEILHDLSLVIPAGSTVAIVGPTGAGKTTLVNLLMRFYDPTRGRILLDGRPLTSLRLKEMRAAWTMVLQDTWLMSGTVAENIGYGAENATRAEIEDAAKRAGVDDLICALPNGYDTRLVDGGLNLSKGEKQLLTIARSMLSGAKMLILDEATSNVDTRTEQRIEKAMLALMEGKTSIVIAHRLSTVRNADMILVVKSGNVIEAGTHTELMRKDGFYASLYRAQFQ